MQIFDRPVVIVDKDKNVRNKDDIGRFNGEPIFVFYNGHNHYDAMLLTGSHSGAQILNELASPAYENFKQTAACFLLVNKRNHFFPEKSETNKPSLSLGNIKKNNRQTPRQLMGSILFFACQNETNQNREINQILEKKFSFKLENIDNIDNIDRSKKSATDLDKNNQKNKSETNNSSRKHSRTDYTQIQAKHLQPRKIPLKEPLSEPKFFKLPPIKKMPAKAENSSSYLFSVPKKVLVKKSAKKIVGNVPFKNAF